MHFQLETAKYNAVQKWHYPRKYKQEMSALSALCILHGSEQEPEVVLRVLEKHASNVAQDLCERAASIFTPQRLGVVLKSFLNRANDPLLDDMSKSRLRTTLHTTGSKLIAAQLDFYHAKMVNESSLDELVDVVKKNGSHLSSEVVHVLANALRYHDRVLPLLEYLISQILGESLPSSEPADLARGKVVDLIACMLSGALQFAAYAEAKSHKQKERTATALSVLFALVGLAPIGGQIAGVAGAIADASLSRLWKVNDARPAIRHFIALYKNMVFTLVSTQAPEAEASVRDKTELGIAIGAEVTYGEKNFGLLRRAIFRSKKVVKMT